MATLWNRPTTFCIHVVPVIGCIRICSMLLSMRDIIRWRLWWWIRMVDRILIIWGLANLPRWLWRVSFCFVLFLPRALYYLVSSRPSLLPRFHSSLFFSPSNIIILCSFPAAAAAAAAAISFIYSSSQWLATCDCKEWHTTPGQLAIYIFQYHHGLLSGLSRAATGRCIPVSNW